jgi:hypothetical protein
MSYTGQVSKQDVLNAIPSRAFADSLVSICFTGTDNETMIVHPINFRREYERFWADPSSVSMLWLGQLFALMCLAVRYQLYSQDESRRKLVAESNPEQLVQLYREKTIHCLVLGDWASGAKHSIETMLLYLFSESLLGDYNKGLTGPWVIWGSLIRIAHKSGYHRDGSHFPQMSCFEAERRRRVWTIIVGWDMYLTIQSALPRMINLAFCDTQEPRSLLDEELYEGMIELPSPRPDDAQTKPQFHVDKNKLLEVFSQVNDLVTTVYPDAPAHPPYTEALKLDRLLTSTWESLQPVWQPHQGARNAFDPRLPATTSVRWTFLSFIYHRTQIVLHRRYMLANRKHGQYKYSRKICLEAAITILEHQCESFPCKSPCLEPMGVPHLHLRRRYCRRN